MSLDKPTSGKRRLKELLSQSDNRVCADCGSANPKWASANIGVFICLKCCGAHRSLGGHISKVLSVTLDEWSDANLNSMMEVGGNDAANAIYEAHFPEGRSKLAPNASHDDRIKYIRSKYELQEFVKPNLGVSSTPSDRGSLQASFSKKLVNSFRGSQKTESSEDIGGFIGSLKITVVKGSNLAVRDMLSSDPYVILTLGDQNVQTSSMRSDLNPVWNEELMLSVPRKYGPVQVKVFDYDTFSADDIMGEAEIEIQPLIQSAMTYGDPEMFGDMQIGQWQKTKDNALVEDSSINIVAGKVKQSMQLKLQDVESGELEILVEWMPLDH